LIGLRAALSSASQPIAELDEQDKKIERKTTTLNTCHTATASLNLYHADRGRNE
jgi:hypothetical protein